MRTHITVVLALLTLTSCAGSRGPEGELGAVQGPPEIQYDIVRQHAEQFDVDVPDRPAGSQHETAAASYILGHLQLAGYSPRLDRVPVANTINSTNVFAYPPNGSDPEYLVAIPYDTPSSGMLQAGRELGLFLELARALAVAEPDHSVAFAGLGAENADARGTRRLAQFLLDEGVEPSVLMFRLNNQTQQAGFYVIGACMGGPGSPYSGSLSSDGCRDMDMRGSALSAAGFQLTYIGGDVEEMGRALLDFLTDGES